MKKVQILNVAIDNVTTQEALQEIRKGVVVTPNVDHLMKLQHDKHFYDIYTAADYVLCDSRVIYYLSKLLPVSVKEQITGSDFFPAFCKYHAANDTGAKVFLLGGTTEDDLNKSIININKLSEKEVVVTGFSPKFGFEKDENAIEEIIKLVNESGANVLAVGLGAPKQEYFIAKYRHRFTAIDLYFAIGATIDFQAGNIKRAPKWMTVCGVEWFFRFLQEPKRMFKRYFIDDLPFFYLFIKHLIGKYNNPF